MSRGDPLDERATALFAAARRERVTDAARERALAGVLEATAALGHVEGVEERTDLEEPVPGTRVARLGRRVFYGAALSTTLAAAATVVLALRSSHVRVPLSPSPEHATTSGALGDSSRLEPEPPPSVTATAASTGTPSTAGSGSLPRTSASVTRERDAGAHGRSSPPSLDDEVNALEEARAALSSGDPKKALERLARYQNVLHGTRLAAEATLLKIQALAESGRRSEAARAARRFIEANPGNPLVDRARSFAEGSSHSSASGEHARGDLP